MALELLSERQVIGTFFQSLHQNTGATWIGDVSNYFPSDQAMETYAWLGQASVMREWLGGRQVNKLKEQGFSIRNRHFESTIEVSGTDLRRDKSGQVLIRVRDMARRANVHWATLLTELIQNASSSLCYDGQYFFDTDHSEGKSGTQSNSISADISAYAVGTHGTTTVPSVPECQMAIVDAINAIVSFKDDQGEPMNEDATSFVILTGANNIGRSLKQAVWMPTNISDAQNELVMDKGDYSLRVVQSVRFNGWTDKFAIFRTDGDLKSFIRQEETGVNFKIKGVDSEYYFDNEAVQYGIDAWRNVGYGMWQNSCLVTLV
jgi:phage major head subunit gpT-like protein